ncbi:MAG: outer membrane protein assembly factor BamD [Thermovibrio sp.]|nr:MAG: outer membrane protein assembly factor BamD [Thermovibrio sp.]
MKRVITCLFLIVFITSCERIPRTSQEQYRKGIKAALEENWGKSSTLLEKALEGELTPKEKEIAKITLADAYFNEGNYENAALNYEEFLELYPASPKAKDALFRLGVCYLNLIKGPQWDVEFAQRAYRTFKKFMENFPDDPRMEKAREYRKLAKRVLAEHEVYIAGTYDMLRKFTASIQRYRKIKEQFSDVEPMDRIEYLIGRAYYYTPIQSKEEIDRLKRSLKKERRRLKSSDPEEKKVAENRIKLIEKDIEDWKETGRKNRKIGKGILRKVIKNYPNSKYAKKAKEILSGKKHLEVEPIENPIKHSIWWKIKETL